MIHGEAAITATSPRAHLVQAVTTFSHVPLPPSFLGITWSKLRSRGGKYLRQYWHLCPSRRNRFRRVKGGRDLWLFTNSWSRPRATERWQRRSSGTLSTLGMFLPASRSVVCTLPQHDPNLDIRSCSPYRLPLRVGSAAGQRKATGSGHGDMQHKHVQYEHSRVLAPWSSRNDTRQIYQQLSHGAGPDFPLGDCKGSLPITNCPALRASSAHGARESVPHLESDHTRELDFHARAADRSIAVRCHHRDLVHENSFNHILPAPETVHRVGIQYVRGTDAAQSAPVQERSNCKACFAL